MKSLIILPHPNPKRSNEKVIIRHYSDGHYYLNVYLCDKPNYGEYLLPRFMRVTFSQLKRANLI